MAESQLGSYYWLLSSYITSHTLEGCVFFFFYSLSSVVSVMLMVVRDRLSFQPLVKVATMNNLPPTQNEGQKLTPKDRTCV